MKFDWIYKKLWLAPVIALVFVVYIMTKLTYGNGLLQTQQGTLSDGVKCLTITRLREPQPINSTPRVWKNQVEEESVDCILAFKNIEGARTLQDELNELISIWSRERGLIVDPS